MPVEQRRAPALVEVGIAAVRQSQGDIHRAAEGVIFPVQLRPNSWIADCRLLPDNSAALKLDCATEALMAGDRM